MVVRFTLRIALCRVLPRCMRRVRIVASLRRCINALLHRCVVASQHKPKAQSLQAEVLDAQLDRLLYEYPPPPRPPAPGLTRMRMCAL